MSLPFTSLPLCFILRAYGCPRQEDFRDGSKIQDLKIRPFNEESSAPYPRMKIGKIPEFMNHDARIREQSPKYFAFKQANWKCRCPVLSHWTPTEETKLGCPCCFHQILRLRLDVNDVNPIERPFFLYRLFCEKTCFNQSCWNLFKACRHDDRQ